MTEIATRPQHFFEELRHPAPNLSQEQLDLFERRRRTFKLLIGDARRSWHRIYASNSQDLSRAQLNRIVAEGVGSLLNATIPESVIMTTQRRILSEVDVVRSERGLSPFQHRLTLERKIEEIPFSWPQFLQENKERMQIRGKKLFHVLKTITSAAIHLPRIIREIKKQGLHAIPLVIGAELAGLGLGGLATLGIYLVGMVVPMVALAAPVLSAIAIAGGAIIFPLYIFGDATQITIPEPKSIERKTTT